MQCKQKRQRFRWPNTISARSLANASQRVHKDYTQSNCNHGVDTTIILFGQCHRYLCFFFLHNWARCIYGFAILVKMYVTKGNDAKNQAIHRFFIFTEGTQLNAVHV